MAVNLRSLLGTVTCLLGAGVITVACGPAPGQPAVPKTASVEIRFTGALDGSMTASRVTECVPGSLVAIGDLNGDGITLSVTLGGQSAPGPHPAVNGAGHPVVALGSTGSLGPTGSATAGTVTVGPDGRSGSVEAELALTRGGAAHVSGSWSC